MHSLCTAEATKAQRSRSTGFAVADIIEWSRIPVYTTAIGMIASAGLLVFMTGCRVLTPHTSVLSHRHQAWTTGDYSQLIAGRKEEDLMHARILDHYLRHTNAGSKEELERTLLRDVDTWLSPDEAVQFGLADMVERLGRQA